MLTRRAVAATTLAGPLVLAPPPGPIGHVDQRPPDAPSETASAAPVEGGFEVTVTSSSTLPGGAPFRRTTRARVPAMCWMRAEQTGREYAADWGPGGPKYVLNDNGGYPWQRLVREGYQDHADSDGRWYVARCLPDAPPSYTVRYLATHPDRFVEPGQPAPAADPQIDPEVLLQAARDAMTLPTGTLRWNPSLTGSGATVVNVATFVWVENSTTAVQVRAQIDATDTWAQIDATLQDLTLHADGAEDDTVCADNGTPHTAGTTSSSCSIVFTRSSANQPVKAGQTLPTSTLTATARWGATWTSSLDPTPKPLDVPRTTTTAEVPVAEIQAIVTR